MKPLKSQIKIDADLLLNSFIDSITLDLVTLGYGPGITAALDLDYFDTMQITNDGQGGSTIVKTLQCQGVAHDITPNTWVTVLTTQEALLDVMY